METVRLEPQRQNLTQRLWAWANHDFCPNQNRWAYKLKHPVAVVTISAILATFCGVVINPLAYVLAGVLWTVLIVGLVWPAIAVRGVTVTLVWGRTRVHAGDGAAVRVRMTNRLPVPVSGLRLTSLGGVGDALLPRIGPFASADLEWRTATVQRGVFPSEEMAIPSLEMSRPFGVWTSERPLAVEGRLTVWPDKTDLQGRIDVCDSRAGEDRLTDRRAGDAGDLLGVRKFRLGDSLRRVHWAQTARQRELIICERQASVSSLIRVGVDLPDDATRFEEVLSATASVVDTLSRTGTLVELWVGNTPTSATTDARQLFDFLATLGPAEQGLRCAGDVDIRVTADGAAALTKAPIIALSGDDWKSSVKAAWRRACGAA